MPPRIRPRSTWRRSRSSTPAARTRPSPSPCRGLVPGADPERGRRGGLPDARSRRPTDALRPPVRRAAGPRSQRSAGPGRCRHRRLGRDDRAPGPRAARLQPPEGPADDAVGHPARVDDAVDARRHPRHGPAGGRGRGPGPLRARRRPASGRPCAPSASTRDFTIDNALVDDDGRITGIVDFGDMSYSALAVDIASVIDSLANGRAGDELFRVSRLVIDGYERVTPLEPVELELMAEFIATRSAVTIAIPAWRAARGLEDADFAERYTASAEAIVRTILDTGWDESARRLGAPRRSGPARAGGPRGPPGRGPRSGPRAADLRAPDPDGQRPRRLDDRHGRSPLPRRVQQRPVRRARAPTGRRGRPPARPASSTRTCAISTSRRSSWPSASPRPARTAWTRSCS